MKFNALQFTRILLDILLALIIAGGTMAPVLHGQAQGQEDTPEKLLQFTSNGHVLGFGSSAIYLAGAGHALSVEFYGGRSVKPVAEGAAGTWGSKPFSKVSYSGVWRYIDIIYTASDDGLAKSTYIVRPGGDPADISLRYNIPCEITPEGGLRFQSGESYFIESAPVAWQESGGQRLPVPVSFRQLADGRVGFSTSVYDKGSTLYIDPLYQWHTFHGSASGDDQGLAIALDLSGNIYVTGKSTATWNGPSGQAPLHAYGGGTVNRNLFVLKLNSAGAYQWHTFYGGSSGQGDDGNCIAMDSSNNVYVGGSSYLTWNGPSGQAPLHAHATAGGGFDILILKLNSAGAYQWHTYYGNNTYSYQDGVQGIALDASANIYAIGGSLYTWNGDSSTPPLHAHASTDGKYDIMVLKLSSAGAYQWHTFYGCADQDLAYGSAQDSSGNIYITGYSAGTWNGPSGQSSLHDHQGAYDMMVIKLNSAGTYQWHTFYGGTGSEGAYSMAVDSSANLYLAGYSNATWNGPSGQAPVNAFAGTANNATIVKLNSAGAYQWHTFHGGSSYDMLYGIAVNTAGTSVYATGTSRGNWNGPGPTPPTNPFVGGADLIIIGLDGSGVYQYHTYYGSTNYSEEGHAAVVNSSGVAYIAGYTRNWSTCSGQAPVNPYTGGNDILVMAPRSESPPRVLTDNATMAGTSATLNGNVTDINGTSVTQRGFVWDTTSRAMPCAVPPAAYANYWTESGGYSTGSFTHILSGLTPNTIYYYRAYAMNNSGDYAYGVEQPFQTLAEPPVVSTAAADNLTYHSARLNGSLTGLGTASPATLSFEYGLTDSYGSTTAGVPSSAGSVPAAFTASLDPLSSGTTYHFRAKAVTTDGTGYGDDRTLTTYTSPSVSASAAGDVTNQSATLNGNLTSLGSASSVNVSFDYGTSSGSYTVHTTPASRSATGAFTAGISSLSPSTTYYWRAVADGGTAYGTAYSTPEQSFITKTPPTVVTDISSGISGGNVTLHGALTSMGTATGVNVSFEYGTTSGGPYPNSTTSQSRTSLGAYSQALSGLSNGTYYYRAKADGSTDGTGYGAEKSFTIGGGSTSPSATTQPATSIGGSSATFNANITSLGSAASVNWSFQWGTASGYYPNETVATAKNTAGTISFPQAGLSASTTYYYRVKIDAGSAGGVMGAEKSFITGNTCPTANTDVATAIGATSATLNGNLLSLGTAGSVNVSFQYGTSPGIYTGITADTGRSAPGAFNAPLTGLAADTTYYYRARVDDGTSGGAFGAEKSFRTGSTCPVATTELVNPIGATTATLHGNVSSMGSASSVSVTFQWGTSPGVYINETSPQALGTPVPFTSGLTGLTYGNTYYYRARADGGLHGGSFGNEMSFSTDSTTPTVLTDTPTAISATGATVNGVVTSMGTATNLNSSFKWGAVSGSYPVETPQQSMGAPGTFNTGLTGLTPGATYYYRAKTVNDPHGGAFGDELAFRTGSTCPTATTQTATSITASGAVLNGNLLTMGSATSINACFQWGSAPGVYNNQTPVHSVASLQPFTADLAGLTDGVTYYYRAKADGGVYGSAFGAEKSFTAGRTCPSVTTDTPTSITATGAQLNGILTSGGTGAFPMQVSFQWGSASGVYPNETTQQACSSAGTYSAVISGLTSGNLYYYRARVDDGTSGGAFGSERSFRAGSVCPTATTQPATGIGATGATINGNLLTLGSADSVAAFFQWGTVSTVYTNETIAQTMTAGAPFSENLTGLSNGVTCYYRVKVDGGVNGSVLGSEKSFTTGRTNPAVETDGATAITFNGGTLNGRWISLGTASSACVSFQWGTVPGVYPNETTTENRTSIGVFNAVLSGLSDNTTYYYRAKVDDGDSGGAFGAERSFRTGSVCPTATTQPATGITPTGAILQGNLLSKGTASVVDAYFQWGTAPSAYTDQTLLQAMSSPAPFFASLDGLTDGVTYYYRVMVDGGSNGICFGFEKSFTAGKNNPVVITDVPTGISTSAATLNGVFTSMGSAPSVDLSFQWGTETGVYLHETTPVSAAGVRNFNTTITGLSDSTTYYYRAKADDGVSGGAFGVERAFMTGGNGPDLATEPATGVTVSTAVLNANLKLLRGVPSCNITFQWGSAAGACIEETTAITRTAPGIVSCNLTGLSPDTVYYFRAKADGGMYGGALGVEKQFTTSSSLPAVATGSAFVTSGSAMLNGNLASLGSAANSAVSFEWGTTTGSYPYETLTRNMGGTGTFSATVNNLRPNTTYYYRAKADAGRFGGGFGVEKSFRTAGGNSAAESATNRGVVTFSSDAGNLVDLVALKASDSGCTLNANEFRYGLFSFKIVNLAPGSTAVVTIELPGTVPASTKYFKCINNMKVDVTSILGHNDGDRVLTLRLTDGGIGDADGLANGTIVDPGGPLTGVELIGAGSHSAMLPSNTPGAMPDKSPVALSNIRVQSAALSSTSIVKGESIEVTAHVANSGNADGKKLVRVYLNGEEAGAQLVHMNRGMSTDATFSLDAQAPGHYVVQVDNVAAGEFDVKLVRDSDIVLIFSWACISAAFILGLVLIVRRLLEHSY